MTIKDLPWQPGLGYWIYKQIAKSEVQTKCWSMIEKSKVLINS